MTENRTFIEIIADNVEDAVAQGLFELGVDEEDVEVEVLDSGGADENRQARVRLTVRPEEHAVEDEEVSASRIVLRDLLSVMRIRGRVSTQWVKAESDEEEKSLILNVQGDDLGMLIGHKGETLAALQYLTRVLVARKLGHALNVVVDIENYKYRREEQLKRIARRAADQSAQQGRTITLEPMPPNERRIIHLALRDRKDVTTESVGEGRSRKVTILPTRQK